MRARKEVWTRRLYQWTNPQQKNLLTLLAEELLTSVELRGNQMYLNVSAIIIEKSSWSFSIYSVNSLIIFISRILFIFMFDNRWSLNGVVNKEISLVLKWYYCRHRRTGRYEARLWDNSSRRNGQSQKGSQCERQNGHVKLSAMIIILQPLFPFRKF